MKLTISRLVKLPIQCFQIRNVLYAYTVMLWKITYGWNIHSFLRHIWHAIYSAQILFILLLNLFLFRLPFENFMTVNVWVSNAARIISILNAREYRYPNIINLFETIFTFLKIFLSGSENWKFYSMVWDISILRRIKFFSGVVMTNCFKKVGEIEFHAERINFNEKFRKKRGSFSKKNYTYFEGWEFSRCILPAVPFL